LLDQKRFELLENYQKNKNSTLYNKQDTLPYHTCIFISSYFYIRLNIHKFIFQNKTFQEKQKTK